MGIFVATLLLSMVQSGFAYWWALGTGGLNVVAPDNARAFDTSAVCSRLNNISDKQKKMCREYSDLLPSMALGARISIDECKHQFRNNRWNCPINEGSSVFGKILNKGTRESAFIHAITAAGLASAVTEACAQGKSSHCHCDRTVRRAPPNSGWKWSGCSRDYNFGLQFSEKFVDSSEAGKRRTPRKDMNKHNNRAGREAIKDGLYRKCKCHGLSGSCEIKSCWINLPKFRAVGAQLKEKYDSAHEMRVVIKSKKSGGKKYKKLRVKNKYFKGPNAQDLIYYEKSPSFCRSDARLGSIGTRGRQCNITSSGADGCDQMCCQRGYDFKAVPVVKSCNCNFVWCCKVKCEKCTVIEKIYTCK